MKNKNLSTTEAARRWNVSPSTILRACYSGKLKGFTTPGGHFRLDERSVNKFFAARQLRKMRRAWKAAA